MKAFFLLLSLSLSLSLFSQDRTFRFTTSDSVSLHVRVAGKGRPCVFIHGGPGSTAYYFEATPAAKLLEEKLQMIYFDQRGCGRSGSAANRDYSLARLEKDLEELRRYLKLNTWALMGHSFGGILSTSYAANHPAAVSAVLMIHGTLNMEYSMTSHLETGLRLLNITDQAPYRDTAKPLIQRVGMVHQQLTEKGIWYKLMYRNAYEKKYNDSITFSQGSLNWEFSNAVWGVKDYWKDFAPRSAAVKCPVLIMSGRQDYAIGPEHYKSFRFPRASVVQYIGGHAPFQEEPQWFAETVLRFLGR
jgi:proline iminopeptidase